MFGCGVGVVQGSVSVMLVLLLRNLAYVCGFYCYFGFLRLRSWWALELFVGVVDFVGLVWGLTSGFCGE